MDIPDEIYPRPDYDIAEDLTVYIRNDPMFYRKSFFPAFEEYKKKKDSKVLEKMIQNGLKNYCSKFEIPFSPNELMNKQEVATLVSTLIKDEIENLDESWLARNLSADPQFKAWLRVYKNKGSKQAQSMVGISKHKEFKQKAGYS